MENKFKRLSEKTEKYLIEQPNGELHLSPNAPKDVKEFYEGMCPDDDVVVYKK